MHVVFAVGTLSAGVGFLDIDRGQPMLGSILVFCFFGFCAGGGHWRHPHHYDRHHGHEQRTGGAHAEEDRGRSPNEIVPSDWRSEPADAHQRAFMSPNGSARLTASWTATSQQPLAQHMRDIAFGTGEKLDYIEGGSDWIAVSGIKGDQRFYREAVLACEGRRWHQIEVDYPTAELRSMAKILKRSSRALMRTREAGCEGTKPSEDPSATPSVQDGAGTQRETTGSTGSAGKTETSSQGPAASTEHK